MRNPSGARLSPDPFGLPSETLGEFVSRKQPVHDLSPNEEGQRADAGESCRAPMDVGLDLQHHRDPRVTHETAGFPYHEDV
jgi:hypothetical protein